MSLGDYFKSRTGIIVLNVVSLLTLIIFLMSIGNTFDSIKVIMIVWILILAVFLTYEYKKRKVFFSEVLRCIENLDKKYLISEIIEEPPYIEASLYYYLLKKQASLCGMKLI